MHSSFQSLGLFALVGLSGLSLLTTTEARDKKLLSIFNIVTFNNDPCEANNNKNGTCYTAQECENKNGIASGSCAQSYGVCCTISLGCGETSSENCTYIEISNPNTGNCKTTICPCNNNICQLRLDFNSFVISGPSTTSTTAVTKTVNGGVVLKTGTKSVTQATQCLTDTFSVNGDGNTPPTICGTNTGEHMYVDSDKCCNELNLNFGQTGVGTSLTGNREVNIKVTQIGCNHPNKAPPGCTQYFYGEATSVIKSFNYDGGSHLANQDQNICIRREKGNCAICYSAVTTTADFMLSGKTNLAVIVNKSGSCCGYGKDGKNTNGFDCLQIPGALQKMDLAASLPLLGNFCGRNLGTIELMASMTICQRANSFNLRFLSDQWEFAGAANQEANKVDIGFRLAAVQQSC